MQYYASISPSAYALLMLKGETTIPYAREAAALLKKISGDTYSAKSDPGLSPADYRTRVMHFESRYWSIDQLLEDQPYTNILELSSGFSFRGLALSRRRPVFYIDTDLEGVIAGKKRFVDALSANEPLGHYELQPLNVLDPAAFKNIITRFPPGPIAIVNEGLLVYLDNAEKELLCHNIREALLARGGCWITADIYLQRQGTDPLIAHSEAYKRWQEQHKIEEKKFTDIRDAEAFFNRMGFIVDKEAQTGRTQLHATWRLVTS